MIEITLEEEEERKQMNEDERRIMSERRRNKRKIKKDLENVPTSSSTFLYSSYS